jgi:hypothetical protein
VPVMGISLSDTVWCIGDHRAIVKREGCIRTISTSVADCHWSWHFGEFSTKLEGRVQTSARCDEEEYWEM